MDKSKQEQLSSESDFNLKCVRLHFILTNEPWKSVKIYIRQINKALRIHLSGFKNYERVVHKVKVRYFYVKWILVFIFEAVQISVNYTVCRTLGCDLRFRVTKLTNCLLFFWTSWRDSVYEWGIDNRIFSNKNSAWGGLQLIVIVWYLAEFNSILVVAPLLIRIIILLVSKLRHKSVPYRSKRFIRIDWFLLHPR